ncbi:hypothetical protein CGRA01v4_10259 [Colletotrichum graminicola]|nr:hypothetical protein CGRA01v4_10259 [Colletotrichum graminicola]
MSGPCCSMFRTSSTSTAPFSGSTSTLLTHALRPPVASDISFFSYSLVLWVGYAERNPARRRRPCLIRYCPAGRCGDD